MKVINSIFFLFFFFYSIFSLIKHIPWAEIQTDLQTNTLTEKQQPELTKTTPALNEMRLEVGDIILAINSEKIDHQIRIREFFEENKGQEITILVLRNKEKVELKTVVPTDFQVFGYGSGFEFKDTTQTKKTIVEIVAHHIYKTDFERRFEFSIAPGMRFTRYLLYFLYTSIAFVSFGFVVENKWTWYSVGALLVLGTLTSFSKPFDSMLNLVLLVLLFYSYKKTFSEKKFR